MVPLPTIFFFSHLPKSSFVVSGQTVRPKGPEREKERECVWGLHLRSLYAGPPKQTSNISMPFQTLHHHRTLLASLSLSFNLVSSWSFAINIYLYPIAADLPFSLIGFLWWGELLAATKLTWSAAHGLLRKMPLFAATSSAMAPVATGSPCLRKQVNSHTHGFLSPFYKIMMISFFSF